MDKEPILSFQLVFDQSFVTISFFTIIMVNIALLIFILKSLFEVKTSQQNSSPPRYTQLE